MIRSSLQPLSKALGAQTTTLRQTNTLLSSTRRLPKLAACLSTSPSLSRPKKAGQDGHIDEKITAEYPNMSGPQHAKGPEFIKGDEGSHGQRTLKSFSMTGKVCVVTGGARGLGNLMGRALVESGCNQLAILDLDKDDAQHAANEMSKWLKSEGGITSGELDIRGFACDVANEESVKTAFKGVKDAFGKVNAVINSAGIVENFSAIEYPTDKLQKLYAINVFGSHYVSREAAKLMIADKIQGSIILVASMSGSIVNIPQPQAPYNASKAAVKHLGACLAVEWAKYGIRVNTLSPGYMLTSLTQQMFDRNAEGRELRSKWESMIPLGKMGMPEDLKGAAVYLASDASRYSTGSDLIVDGGYVAT